VKKPNHLEGESLVDTVREGKLEEDPVRHEYVRYNGRYHGRALRTSTHRYVRWVNRKGELELEELYNLEADPHETTNLASSQPAELEELRATLLKQ
jgi:arylsulfatase A-like enzyme